MKATARVLLLCLGAAFLAVPPVAAGPLSGSGYYVLLVLDSQNPEILLNLNQGFVFTDRGVLGFEEQSVVEAEAVLRFDPDPVAAYEFTIRNTTSGPIDGALSLGFDIAPYAGGPPAFARLELDYDDTGGGGIEDRVQQDVWVTEDVTRGETYLTGLRFLETVTSEAEQLLTAGPVALPDPQKRDHYDEFAVQLSFHLQAGDSAVFRGAATFPEPPPVCGDGQVDPLMGEECDPPDGWSCDETCHPVPEPGSVVLRVSALASLGALVRGRARLRGRSRIRARRPTDS